MKVQRPRIGESIAMDMLLLRRLMQAVDRTLPQVLLLASLRASCCSCRQLRYLLCCTIA